MLGREFDPGKRKFFSLKLKNKNKNAHKIRLHGRRGKGMTESFSREKLRHAPQKEGGWEILCDLPPVWPRLVRSTNLMSRMNGKKKHTHAHVLPIVSVPYTFLIIIIRRASCVYYLRHSILASLFKGVHLDWLMIDWLNSRITSW